MRAVVAVVVALAATLAQAQVGNPPGTTIPLGPFRIAGTLVNSKTGSPLARARVTIASVNNRQSTQSFVTEEDGRFEFHVPAGKYSLVSAKRGFIQTAYDQHDQYSTAIVASSDIDSEHLTFRMAPAAVLSGRVLDEVGEPVRNAQIMLYRESHIQGVSRIFPIRGAQTDDQGQYELTPLNEGTYFISARASPWYSTSGNPAPEGGKQLPSQIDPSLDVAYPITYYGDATEAADATPIPVRGGDHLEADIHFTPVPSLHLIVHIPEDPEHGVSLPVLQRTAFDGVEQVEISHLQRIGPGEYELSGVPAGRYTVRMPAASGELKEPAELNLTSGGELDMSSGNPTSQIKATVQVEGSTTLPRQLQIGLRNSKGRVTANQVDEKGEVSFADVVAGRYDLVAGGGGQTFSVVKVSSGAGSVSGHTLTVRPGSSLNLSITLVGGSVTIEGFAKRSDKGTAGAMIVLVPKNPEANRDRFRRDQSDFDGSFSLPNVIPGTYTIVAIENGWDLDWVTPTALAKYVDYGQKVTVDDRSSKTLRLTSAVEVQTK